MEGHTLTEARSPSVLTQVTPPLHMGLHIAGLTITYIVFTLALTYNNRTFYFLLSVTLKYLLKILKHKLNEKARL